MKKLLIIVLAAVMLILSVSCGRYKNLSDVDWTSYDEVIKIFDGKQVIDTNNPNVRSLVVKDGTADIYCEGDIVTVSIWQNGNIVESYMFENGILVSGAEG